MSVEIDLVYEGQLRCWATHGPSQTQVLTDAPVDNHGKGESFSPTDLVATALGACMTTLMGIVADRNKVRYQRGTTVHVVKEMIQEPVAANRRAAGEDSRSGRQSGVTFGRRPQEA